MASHGTKARRKWTPDEDRVLRDYAEDCTGTIDWTGIARQLPDRSNKDCRNRWMKINSKWSRGAWTDEENKRLARGIKAHGCRWTAVSEAVRTRSPDQCSKHWRNSLDPDIVRGGWSHQEDEALMFAACIHGNDWKRIGECYLPNRSSLDLSNRYNLLIRRSDNLLNDLYPSFPGEINQTSKSIMDTGPIPTLADEYTTTSRQSYNPGLDLKASPATLNAPEQNSLSSTSTSLGGSLPITKPLEYSHRYSPEMGCGLAGNELLKKDTSRSAVQPSTRFGKLLRDCPGNNNQSIEHGEPGQPQKTTFVMDNLDSETRAQILDILCKRKVPTTITVKD
ncbi:hypothetical protein AJ79_02313 [Helicocarpus griseus UAMH5409]|uniref:Uncharacterized protein n=1 Tax=Helicocarpus griseus UAMH5409 TaxID=1447875 RepID=A0A2B7Y3B1_9EURO|nr:hypothetical protein AJ79_02313 [Helicocarpus griseus UAMH5409]